MQVQSLTKERATVSLGPSELLILNNALNEVCHGLDLDEFDTRMGTERGVVQSLLDEIGALCDQMNLSVS